MRKKTELFSNTLYNSFLFASLSPTAKPPSANWPLQQYNCAINYSPTNNFPIQYPKNVFPSKDNKNRIKKLCTKDPIQPNLKTLPTLLNDT